MTEHTTYSCDFCGTAYATREEAESCERFHIRPTGTGSFIWSSPDADCPDYLRVDYEDGRSILYSRMSGYRHLPAGIQQPLSERRFSE